MMESLSEILSGASVPDTNASASAAKAEPATDVKTTESAKPDAASATSAEKKDDAKADGKPEGEPVAEDKTDTTRDDKGRFKTDEKDKSAKPDEIASLRKALQAERKKRQELEKAKEPAKDDKPKKDFWDDPEAAIGERVSAETAKVRQETETRFFNLCERLAKAKHDDYEDIVESLMQETEADPALARQVFAEARQSDDPAEFIYSTAKHRSEMKAVGGDLGKYKASVEAPLRDQVTRLEAENKALQDKLEKLGKVPSSLNAQPSATRASVESEAMESESLEEITKPRKRRA